MNNFNLIKYEKAYKSDCIDVFKSNMPDSFRESELDEFIDWLDNGIDDDYFVLEVEDKIVGCGGIYKDEMNNEVGLAWGMIHKEYQGKGYGKELLLYRIEFLKKNFPNKKIILRTTQDTYKFFEKFGFKTIGFTKDGWAEGLDKYVMILSKMKL